MIRRVPRHGQSGRHDTVWLLDLDNTLHDAARIVFPRINQAMTQFIVDRLQVSTDEANVIRMQYWRRYGATLLGLVRHHGVKPESFLADCHPFDDLNQIIDRDHRLANSLRQLRGRRILVTNAPRVYAQGVLQALGIAPLLERVITIEHMQFAGRWQPKPSRPMMRRLVAKLRVPAARCVLVEDTPHNLHHARWLGIRTVLVTGYRQPPAQEVIRHHAGRGRRIQHQVQSFSVLTRVSIR